MYSLVTLFWEFILSYSTHYHTYNFSALNLYCILQTLSYSILPVPYSSFPNFTYPSLSYTTHYSIFTFSSLLYCILPNLTMYFFTIPYSVFFYTLVYLYLPYPTVPYKTLLFLLHPILHYSTLSSSTQYTFICFTLPYYVLFHTLPSLYLPSPTWLYYMLPNLVLVPPAPYTSLLFFGIILHINFYLPYPTLSYQTYPTCAIYFFTLFCPIPHITPPLSSLHYCILPSLNLTPSVLDSPLSYFTLPYSVFFCTLAYLHLPYTTLSTVSYPTLIYSILYYILIFPILPYSILSYSTH